MLEDCVFRLEGIMGIAVVGRAIPAADHGAGVLPDPAPPVIPDPAPPVIADVDLSTGSMSCRSRLVNPPPTPLTHLGPPSSDPPPPDLGPIADPDTSHADTAV